MKETVYLVRDPDRPGRYWLAVNMRMMPNEKGELTPETMVIPWRDAKRRLDLDAYYDLCRMSFSDWCARNPELANADQLDD